ncbi:MAG: 16S rRNA (cytosine(1402)-N(4))-methyltransferase RsmH [Ignavibacteria bacterium]|nr:16S rRNA (cytosine(1402)-N(4))-methyltransferase RsmH [Ignavibacteria bacterium]
MEHHIPVLLNESLEYLITNKSGVYFDGTIGFGGHSSQILSKLSKKAILVGTDKDSDAFNFCKAKFDADNRMKLYHTKFTDIDKISKIEFIEGFDGIFADLGVSSFQLDNKESGFTYREDAKLDLRMNKASGISADEVINTFSKEEIADIIYQFGEEKKSRQIAEKIVDYRKNAAIKTTGQLKEIVEKVIPAHIVAKSLSRVFQALRIYVNNELDELEEFLGKATDLLNNGGRLVILTYHSLEDRKVKEFFKNEALTCICPPSFPICQCSKTASLKILTKKPVIPSEEEIKLNKRARSAKLRAAERI